MPISLKNIPSILPWVRYSPRANKMMISSEDNKSREVAFIGKSFAIDIENGMPGWLLLGKGLRDWKPAPLGSDAPDKTYKRGFSILLYAPKLLGSAEAFEMCSSTGAHLSFCERLFNDCEPHFGKDEVPIVKITEAEAVTVGRGESRELHFEIVKYIPRPAAFTEALAKLKAADSAPPNKDTHPGNGADNVGDDFDDEGVTTAKPEPAAEKAAETKPKTRGKKPPEPPSSDILDDPIPY
jgi:hypothetical protein